MSEHHDPHSADRVLETVRRVWGYGGLRPLQAEAIQAGLDRRDSLVVLPTGGGKSLCYQVPPVVAERTDIVLSPLISLMKDQVDGLRGNGYPARALHSGLGAVERREAEGYILSGKCRLIFVSPERVVAPWFQDLVAQQTIGAIAVDEAHCISHWGHDFRPEYRQLRILRERFPGASLHAFTATATERVRRDICAQLRLQDPALLVGRFDRPNLIYRIVPRNDLREQILEVIERHRGEAMIIYCISRTDTERLAAFLSAQGERVRFYHAGMNASERREAQDEFANESIDIIVATVAFGMGIDRSDVRSVIHTGMPKSIEHYQQETGRAGRDGLEAECVLFYSPADVLRWKGLVEKNAAERGLGPRRFEGSLELLQQIRRFCSPHGCRHRALVEYFGQVYEKEGCGACDVCLGEVEDLEDGTIAAQMILSCVARVGQRFGAGHVVDVLRGSDTERIRNLGHHQLSTHGLMKDAPKAAVTNRIFQLIDQGLLVRTEGDYPHLHLNEASWEVLRGHTKVWLVPVKARKRAKKTAIEKDSWEGVDPELFEELRKLRTEIARERRVPPYVVFSDLSLRDMARRRPATRDEFLEVHGVGEKKLDDLGERFLERIAEHPVPEDNEGNKAQSL